MTPNNFRVKNGLTVSNGVNVTAGNVVITGGQLVIGATAINATSISGSATAAYTNAVSYTDTKIGTANTAMAANAATAYTNAIAIAANATNLTSGTVPFARLPSLYLGTTAIQSTSAAQAVSGITTLAAGNTTISGFANVTSGLSLSNATSNFIDWSTAGVQGPSINTRSPGTKLLLYPALSASQTDYAIGISPATIWSTVPGAEDSFKFKWYGADIEVASLSGAGNMVLSGSINAASHTVGTSFVANTSRVAIGTAVGLQANGGIGTAGQVLHSNGTTVYWAADDGITSLVAANGLSGGTITSTGTISVLGGSTLTVNATGVHVNTGNLSIATSQLTGDVALGTNTSGNYVATITNANGISGSSSAEGGTPTIGVVTGSTLTVNTTGIHVNSALSIASLALSGDITVSGNLTVSGTRTYVNTTTLDVGDNIITLNADLGAAAPSQNAGIEIMRGTSANVQFLWDETNDRWSTNGQPLAVSSFIAAGAASGITTLAAGNTTITGFVNATSSVNAASLTVGTNFVANSTQTTFGTPVLFNNQQQVRFQTVNTSAYAYFTQQNDDNFVFYTSNTTYGARAVFSVFANSINSNLSIAIPLQPTAGIVANASLGSSGQVLKTNGSTVYWDTAGGTGTVTSVATANGLSGGPITATGTIGVVTGSTLTVNSTGIHVNSALSIDQVFTSNNGAGTNVRIGDDAWFGDVNVADTVRVMGQQSANNGYIVFGNADNSVKLGRAGLGALTYNGAFAAGNTTITGFANVVSTGGAQAAVALRSGTYGTFIVPQASAGAYNNLTGNNDNLIYFSNGTINGGNLLIGTWTDRAAGYGVKLTGSTYDISVVANTFTVVANTTMSGFASVASARGGVAAPTLGQQNSSFYVTNSDSNYGLLFGVDPATGRGWIQTQRVDGSATAYALRLNPSGGATEFGAGYNETEVANTAATGTYTMNCSAANFFDLTLTGNITISPSNVPANGRVWSGSIAAKQDATGGRTITWPTGTKYAGGVAPPATTTANALDIWSLMTYDGGTSWIVSLSVKGVA